MTSTMTLPDNNAYFAERTFTVKANPMFLVLVYRFGLGLVFLLGFTGNLASIVTFMRPTLRVTSTGSFFFMMSVSDTIFLLASTFDFVEVGITQEPIFLSSYDNLCRFRWYTKGLAQFCSAWILVLITVDRWLRTRFPFKTKQWCTRRNAFIATMMVAMIGSGLYSHILHAQFFGKRFPGIATEACGPVDFQGSYIRFYFSQWSYVQVVFVCLFPATLMLLGGIDTLYTIRQGNMRVKPTGIDQAKQRRKDRLQRQMLLLMISSVIIFFATTLPVNLRVIVATYQINANYPVDLTEIANQTAILTVFLSFNYAVNFYVHCLASKLFRHEFTQCITVVYRRQGATMHGSATATMQSVTNNLALNQLRLSQTHA